MNREGSRSPKCFIAINTLAAVMTVLGLALTQACGAEAGRYTFQTLPDGLMRLDTATGEMSLCTKRSVGWVCAAVADDRAALDAEVGRLERENARLKSALLAHGLRLPEGVTGEAGGGLELPDARQLDRLMGFFERLWGRLLDMVRTLQNDWATDKDFEEREPRFPDRSHKEKT
jgi:hypothetical protein